MSATTPILPDAVQSALAERLKRGDEAVLETILQSFGPWTEYRLRQKYPTLTHTDLEDILVDTLYQVWKDRQKYNGDLSSLQNWFYVIAKNKAEDVRKSKMQKARILERSADFSRIAVLPRGDDDGPSSLSAEQQDLLDILHELPELERRIMCAYAGAEDLEAWAAALAQELGVSPGLIRVKRVRIEKKIRRELQKRGHFLSESGD
jgi:RNA polymerase sigma factor (sigma-70 family)